MFYRMQQHIPAVCAICHNWPAQPVCDVCQQAHGRAVWRCPQCAVALPAGVVAMLEEGQAAPLCADCARAPWEGLDGCWAAVSYQWPWRGLIERFKFQQQPGWAQPLAQLMAQDAAMVAAVQQADVLLPIPLHSSRLAQRGYNQSALLARALRAHVMGMGAVGTGTHQPRLLMQGLQRVRATDQQSHLGRAQRLRNLREAMQVHPRHATTLVGARVLLVDDVLTTGTTLQAAAVVLRDAGCQQVQAVVLARTEKMH